MKKDVEIFEEVNEELKHFILNSVQVNTVKNITFEISNFNPIDVS